MPFERPDLKKDPPPIPSGVPGERDTTFEELDQRLHDELTDRFTTDSPEKLKRNLQGGGRENFYKQYGSPDEIIKHTRRTEREAMQEKDRRMELIRKVRQLQEGFNLTLGRLMNAKADKTNIENALLGQGDLPWYDFSGKAERSRLTVEAAQKSADIAQYEQQLVSIREALKGLGFPMSEEEKNKYKPLIEKPL